METINDYMTSEILPKLQIIQLHIATMGVEGTGMKINVHHFTGDNYFLLEVVMVVNDALIYWEDGSNWISIYSFSTKEDADRILNAVTEKYNEIVKLFNDKRNDNNTND